MAQATRGCTAVEHDRDGAWGGRAAGGGCLAQRHNAAGPRRAGARSDRRSGGVFCQSRGQRFPRVVGFRRPPAATAEHPAHCVRRVRRVSAAQPARRRGPDRPRALSALCGAGTRGVLVSRDHHRVVADRMGRAGDCQRCLSGGAQCRAHAALLPAEPLHAARRSLRDVPVRTVPAVVPRAQVPPGS